MTDCDRIVAEEGGWGVGGCFGGGGVFLGFFFWGGCWGGGCWGGFIFSWRWRGGTQKKKVVRKTLGSEIKDLFTVTYKIRGKRGGGEQGPAWIDAATIGKSGNKGNKGNCENKWGESRA